MFSIILLLLKTISNQFPAFNIQHRLAPEMFQNFVLKSYVICYNFPHSRECIVAESFVCYKAFEYQINVLLSMYLRCGRKCICNGAGKLLNYVVHCTWHILPILLSRSLVLVGKVLCQQFCQEVLNKRLNSWRCDIISGLVFSTSWWSDTGLKLLLIC